MRQKNIWSGILLTSSLAMLWGPIVYFGHQNYSFKEIIFAEDKDLNVAAQKYINSGQWPSARKESKLISDFEKFNIQKADSSKEPEQENKIKE
ncbi:hypothetical protein E2K93_03225 [Thalassotalea sp. HSM 43]|uniref:hypothetical protein n=1 Tax=Thalassotalea sp. HSM 43 TaxID=2552945 RepID=UPI001081685B|nr:hypothetical protein [Thalassotalea sp. HSM 43]QBY03444.1 hypothetical protein E2K93_03225 [Thalassotalea sp. HSM 43]